MEEDLKISFKIKTEEIFTKFKYEKIPNNFEDRKTKNIIYSKQSTRDPLIKLEGKERDNEIDESNNTYCDSINNPDIQMDDSQNYDIAEFSNKKENNYPIENSSLLNRKNSSIKNRSEKQQINRDNFAISSVKSNSDSSNNQILVHKHEEQDDIIPTSHKIIYSLASFGKMSCLVLLNIHALLFYESIGASLLYMSFFVALARAAEIILKPSVAHISDVTVSKYGRRKPYMILGCFFYAFFLVMLFCSPSMKAGSTYISLWFGIFYTLFFIADTITNVPYLALGPELSTNFREREKLYLYFYVFQYIGVLFAAAAPVVLNKFYPPCDCSFCLTTPEILDVKECLSKCQVLCNVKTSQSSLFYIAVFIGIFYIFSVVLIFFKIPEKHVFIENNKENDKKSTQPKLNFKNTNQFFIPSLYRLANNKPFLMLLTPWIIDLIITTIFAAMLPFFLNFVINPQKYCKENNLDLNSETCNVNMWLAYSISTFFISCILFTFMWHYLVKKFGKKKCWQSYSLISILVFSLFLLCDKGSMRILIFASFCCSIPAGGAYLNDVFMSDIIDYDEFICGQRNEGVFTVFSAFIPKVVSIFAQSIPLTIMTFLGFVSSNKGESQDQPEMVIQFIRFYFIILPCILAFISFIFKMDYPIEDDTLMDDIRNQIDSQKKYFKKFQGKVDYVLVYDPIMKNDQLCLYLKNEIQIATFIVVEHFSDLEYLKIFYRRDIKSLKKQIKMNLIGSSLLLIIFLITLISTFTFLQNKNLNLIPLFSLFIVAISIVFLVVNTIRCKVLQKVSNGDYEIDNEFLKLYILKKYYEHEKILRKNENFKKPEYVKNIQITENKEAIINNYSDFIIESDISRFLRQDYKANKEKDRKTSN